MVYLYGFKKGGREKWVVRAGVKWRPAFNQSQRRNDQLGSLHGYKVLHKDIILLLYNSTFFEPF